MYHKFLCIVKGCSQRELLSVSATCSDAVELSVELQLKNHVVRSCGDAKRSAALADEAPQETVNLFRVCVGLRLGPLYRSFASLRSAVNAMRHTKPPLLVSPPA